MFYQWWSRINMRVTTVTIVKTRDVVTGRAEASYTRNFSGKVHVGAELWSHRCSQNYCEDPVSTGVQLRFSLLRMKQNASSIKSRCFADFIDQVIQQEWPEKQDDKWITWIVTATHGKAAISYMAYGNEPSQEVIYLYAAIIAVIQLWPERRTSLENRNPGVSHSWNCPLESHHFLSLHLA
jgi:hypothetical protein